MMSTLPLLSLLVYDHCLFILVNNKILCYHSKNISGDLKHSQYVYMTMSDIFTNIYVYMNINIYIYIMHSIYV